MHILYSGKLSTDNMCFIIIIPKMKVGEFCNLFSKRTKQDCNIKSVFNAMSLLTVTLLTLSKRKVALQLGSYPGTSKEKNKRLVSTARACAKCPFILL